MNIWYAVRSRIEEILWNRFRIDISHAYIAERRYRRKHPELVARGVIR